MFKGLRAFVVISAGQFVSLLGFQLTSFATALWILETTGSVAASALVPFVVMFGVLLASLVAGRLVDGYDRRRLMLASDTGAGLLTLVIAALLNSTAPALPLVYLALCGMAAFRGIQWTAHPSLAPLLVPVESLGRTAGILRLCDATGRLVVPVIGAGLLLHFGVREAVLLAAATYVPSALCLLSSRIPRLAASVQSTPLLAGIGYAWRYLRSNRGLLTFALFASSLEFYEAGVLVLLPPLILSMGGTAEVGTVMSVGGLGMVAGSLVMTVWGGGGRKVAFIFVFAIGEAIALLLGATPAGLVGLAIAAFAFFFCADLLYSNSMVLFQTRVDPASQGRVFAFTYLLNLPSSLAGYLIVGCAADHVGGGSAASLRMLLGLLGLMALTGAVLAFQHPKLQLSKGITPVATEAEPA